MSNQVGILLDRLPDYQGKTDLITYRQQTYDIIHEVLKMHKNTAQHYDNIAPYFLKRTPEQTANYLFLYCRKYLPYKEENIKTQTVKEPQAILHERIKYGNDCKHYASFIVGVGDALKRMGYPADFFYRFASYEKENKRPSHVFAVCRAGNKEYWIDPVPQIKYFDDRRIYPEFFIDKKIQMKTNKLGSLYAVGSIENMTPVVYEPGSLGRPKHRLKLKLPHIKIQPGQLFKKVLLAPSRNAFLLYLKIDLFHTGHNLYKKIMTNPAAKAKVFGLWKKAGGNPNKLMTALTQANKVFNKHHAAHKFIAPGSFAQHVTDRLSTGNAMHGYSMGVAGVDDSGYAGVIAAASPLIAMFSNLLKSLGISHASKEDVNAAHEVAISKHNKAGDDSGADDSGAVDQGNGITTKVTKDKNGKQTIEYGASDTSGEDADDTDGDGSKAIAKSKNSEISTVDNDAPPGSNEDNPANIAVSSAKDFVVAHKTAFIIGGVGLAAIIVLPLVFRSHKKKRR